MTNSEKSTSPFESIYVAKSRNGEYLGQLRLVRILGMARKFASVEQAQLAVGLSGELNGFTYPTLQEEAEGLLEQYIDQYQEEDMEPGQQVALGAMLALRRICTGDPLKMRQALNRAHEILDGFKGFLYRVTYNPDEELVS